jgi:hypothetical protein
MKINRYYLLGIIFGYLLIVFNNAAIKAQTQCILPTMPRVLNSGTITSVVISDPSSAFAENLFIATGDNQNVAKSPLNTEKNFETNKKYTLKVKIRDQSTDSQLGLYIDNNSNGSYTDLSDGFFTLSLNNLSKLYETNFEIPALKQTSVNFAILSEMDPKLGLIRSSICTGNSYTLGELELYSAGIVNCIQPSITQFSAGANDTICAGQEVILNPIIPTSIKIQQYLWTSSDINFKPTPIINPKTRPTFTSSYTLNIIDAGTGCEYSDVKSILVDLVPSKAVLTSNLPEICEGQRAILVLNNVPNPNALLVEWWRDGDSKPISTASVSSIGITQPGKYYARLLYKKLQTCSKDWFTTPVIEVKKASTPSITISSNSLCVGEGKLEAKSNDKIYSQIWYIDGKIFAQDVNIVTPTSAGNYYMTAKASNLACEGQSQTVTVNLSPQIPTTKESFVEYCPKGTSSISAVPGSNERLTIAGFEWFDVKTNTLVSKTNPFVVNQSGEYRVRAIASGSACPSKLSEPVSVNQAYLPPMLDKFGDITLCQNQPIAFNVINVGEGIRPSPITWYLGSSTGNPIVPQIPTQFVTAANYTGKVFVKGKNSLGCDVIDSANIIVNTAANAIITPGGPICEGNGGYLKVNITNGKSYTWSKGDEVFQSFDNYLDVTEPGLYNVSVRIDANCIKTASYNVVLIPNPAKPTFANLTTNQVYLCGEGNSKVFTAVSTNSNNTFVWYAANRETTLAQTASLAIKEAGTYYVHTKSPQGCSSEDTLLLVKIDEVPKPFIFYNTDGNSTCLSPFDELVYNMNSQTRVAYLEGNWFLNDVDVARETTFSVEMGVNYKPTSSGLYHFIYKTKNGCTSEKSNAVFIYPNPPKSAPTTFKACQFGDALLLPTQFDPKIKYTWTYGKTQVSFREKQLASTIPDSAGIYVDTDDAGEYFYILTSRNLETNCFSFDTTLVNVVQNNLTLQVSATNPDCEGGLGKLKAFAPLKSQIVSYEWLNTSVRPNELSTSKVDSILTKPGVYTVTITDADGCKASSSENVIVEPQGTNLIITSKLIKNPSCSLSTDGIIQVDVNNLNGTPTYTWTKKPSNSVFSSAANLSNLSAGTYQLTVKDLDGCKSFPVTLTDTLKLKPGEIFLADTEVDFGVAADTIKNIIAASGSNTPIKLSWEQQDSQSISWKPLLAKDTLANYIPGVIKSNVNFRRVAANTCGKVYSNIVSIKVLLPSARDSVAISGGGELGQAKIKLDLFGKAPWSVILSRVDGQVIGYDTISQIQTSPFEFTPKRKGVYTPFSVNQQTNRGSGSAVVFVTVIDTTKTTAIISGGGVLGSNIRVVIRGRKNYPVTYTYEIYEKQSNKQLKQATLTFSSGDTLRIIETELVGFYRGLSVKDSDGKLGDVIGLVQITAPNTSKPPTADISGGGLIGSIISVNINPNGTLPPWEVVIEIESKVDTVVSLFEFSTVVSESSYSFSSSRVGTYRIKSVNGNREGNGEAVVIIDDKDSSEVFVWNAVSPNGDDKNDEFIIEIPKRLSSKNASIVIFDREGTKLINLEILIGDKLKLNAAEDMYIYKWNCKNDLDELLNPGTYFYSFKVEGSEKDKKASKSGFIEVRR